MTWQLKQKSPTESKSCTEDASWKSEPTSKSTDSKAPCIRTPEDSWKPRPDSTKKWKSWPSSREHHRTYCFLLKTKETGSFLRKLHILFKEAANSMRDATSPWKSVKRKNPISSK